MKKFATLFVISILLVASVFSVIPANAAYAPDTWAMMDGLGRVLSDNSDVGNVDNTKSVGMFYWPWHEDFANDNKAYNLTEILAEYPDAVNDFNHAAWEGTAAGTYYFWDKPIFGYYSTDDMFVIRKQAELLGDAGVDVIFMDCTNGTFLWDTGVDVVFRVFQQAAADGIKVPKIGFVLNLAGSTDTQTQLVELYDTIYSQGNYSDLWFYWDGKPLILANSSCLDSTQTAIKNFFTFRSCEPGYNQGDTSVSDNRWGWLNVYPQAKHCVDSNGNVEQMTVSVAQNWNSEGLVAMNDPTGGVQGRSYTYGNYYYTFKSNGTTTTVNKSIANSAYYGLNFQQQWDYAISNDPEMIFVTGWNEWVAGRQEEWQGTENAFPDQFSVEYSRDIEPSEGVLKDYYYTQLIENIRRFKGVSSLPTNDADAVINIYAVNDQWADILPEYTHTSNTYGNRDSYGYGNIIYRKSKNMKNDITTAKVAYDDNYVYFMVEAAADITEYTQSKWMRLLIDTDTDSNATSWEGFEYILNRLKANVTETTTVLEKSTGGWNFETVGTVEYTVSGNRMQVKIPRSYLGLGTGKDIPSFNFKWADNNLSETAADVMDFYYVGDCAPGSRFAFVFDASSNTTYAPTEIPGTYTPTPVPTASPTPTPTATPSVDNFELDQSSSYTKDDTNLLIKGVTPGTTADDFLFNFVNLDLLIMKDGTEIYGSTVVGTGTIITDGILEYAAVQLGDINGDGKVATADYMLIKKAITGYTLSAAQTAAADVDSNSKVATADYMKVKKYIVGDYELY